MGEKSKLFQYGVLIAFAVLGVASVIIFSLFRTSTVGSINTTPIKVWGTVDSTVFDAILKSNTKLFPELQYVTYQQFTPSEYSGQLTQAFSEDRGPDLYITDQSMLMTEFPRLTPIGYSTLTERDFRDTYIDASNVLLFTTGILGLPFAASPLVMYWNKDIFVDAGLVEPPKFWDELFILAPKISKSTDDGRITKSLVAFGDYDNISHAKEIISALMFAAGSPITQWNKDGLEAVLDKNTSGVGGSPAEAALRFYTEFANPIKTAYSWHRSMPSSREAFLAGDLALYFGFANEAKEFRDANPNLNFDITELPQSRTAPRRSTYVNILAFSVPKKSRDPQQAYRVASILTSAQISTQLSSALGLAPVRRDALSTMPASDSAYWSVVYQSTIIGKTWLEPNARGTATAFARMVEAVTSGRSTATEATKTAQSELQNLLKQQ